MVAPVAARAVANTDATMLLIGAGALLILAKWGIGNIPSIPNPFPTVGLVRERGAVYTTGGPGPGGQMAAVPWMAMDIVEPDQSWGKYFFEIDLPGVPAYDVRDLYSSTVGRVLR